MKSNLLRFALLLLPLAASAVTQDLGTRGTFSITPPKDWTVSVHAVADTGFSILFSPPGDVNAKGMVTLIYVPDPKPVSKEQVDDETLQVSEQFVSSSVEKKKNLRDFGVSGGAHGSYCVFTDSSLVGKPPERDNFKVVGVGVVHFTDDVMAAVSILSDDANGADFKALLAAVSSASVAKK